MNAWTFDAEHNTWTLEGRDCRVWMDARPPYCDRGRWLAHVDLQPSAWPRLSVDESDRWPRYYFDLERAKAEIEAWLYARDQRV